MVEEEEEEVLLKESSGLLDKNGASQFARSFRAGVHFVIIVVVIVCCCSSSLGCCIEKKLSYSFNNGLKNFKERISPLVNLK